MLSKFLGNVNPYKRIFLNQIRRCLVIKKFFIFLCAVLLVPMLVHAQAGQTGSITGVVLTPEGEPLPGVTVVLTSPAIVVPSLETITNEVGRYRFVSLSPGEYELNYSLPGVEGVVRRGIQVAAGMTLTLDVNMTLRTTDEFIVVEGQAPTIDKMNTKGVTSLNVEFLQSIPSPRQLVDYFNMAPGVTGSVAHGSSTKENSYNLDGVNIADPDTGTQLVSFGMDVMEEISIQSGGLSAEYGSVKGAVINVISKQGGNDYHGSASFYYNHEKLQSDNTEGTGVEGTSGNQWEYEPGITLGGPVLRDKLWFFTNMSFWRSSYFENGYPADDPDNPIAIKEMRPYPYLKFTFQPNQANKFVFSYNYSDRRLDHRFAAWNQTEGVTAIQTSPTHVFNFHWNRQFSSNLFTEFKVAVVRSTLTFEGKDPNQGYHLDVETGIWSGSYFRALDENPRNRYQFNANATAFIDDLAGSHELKIGGELQLGRTGWKINFSQDPQTGLSYMIDFPEYFEQFGLYNYGYYIVDFERKEGFNNVGLYVNDAWSPTKWLTVNLGARFEYNATIWPPQMEEEGPQEFMGLSYNRSITETMTPMKWVNLVPRLGIILDPFQNGSTLIKASYGRYVQPNITEWVNLGHPNGWFYYAQQYDWEGNLVGDPYAINLPGGQIVGYPGYNDGKLKAPYVDEVTVGIERELFEDWSVGFRYIRKWDRNLIENVDASQLDMDALLNDGELIWTNWEPVTGIDPYDGQEVTFWDWSNPYLPNEIYIINPPGAERDYDGLEFKLSKRYSSGWQVHLTYVYQKSRGLIPTADSQSGGEANGMRGTSALYENPNAHYNAVGRFPRERRHMLKLHGLVRGPWGINLSGYFSVMSGRRYTRRVSSGGLGLNLYTDVVTFAEPLGGHGYPTLTNLDLRLEKEFRIKGIRMSVFGDAFNIFNDNAVTVVRTISNRTSYEFQDPRTIVPPRIFQLGAKIEF